ncbi:MAG: DUF3467 domain-containing protein [Myxococcales bacterium]|jgi:hypothetical protein
MSENDKPKEKIPAKEVQLQIDLDDQIAQGMYCNLAMVNHTPTEFTLDFIYVQPQQPKAKVRARIITSPQHMKRLLLAMQDNLSRYERAFGTIDLGRLPEGPIH